MCSQFTIKFINRGCSCERRFQIQICCCTNVWCSHDEVIKWKHFPRCGPCVHVCWGGGFTGHRGTKTSDAFSFIYSWTNSWVNNNGTGDLRRRRPYHDVTLMKTQHPTKIKRKLFVVFKHGWRLIAHLPVLGGQTLLRVPMHNKWLLSNNTLSCKWVAVINANSKQTRFVIVLFDE